MRIVFVNRIAWPDAGATAIYLTDVAEACAAAGHEVHVVCGEATYRGGEATAPPDATHAGVAYHRIPGARGEGLWRRGWASLRFVRRARRALRALPTPDVVVALTDPPFLDATIGPVARRHGARVVHWWMDVYPDVLFAADVLRPHGLLARTLRSWMARRVRRADAVVVLGRAMRRPALAHGLPRARLHVIENWAPRDVEAQAGSELARAPDAPLTLLYSGNLGRAHDLTGLARAVRALPADAPLRLVVQAGGSGVARAKALFEDAPVPVEWRDPVALHDLAASLRAADLHVVSVRDGFERLVVPSKVYGPLALGLPLLVLGSRRCEPARIVKARGCGHVWSSDAEARDGLLRLVREGRGGLRRVEPLRRRALGISAWRALLEDLGAGARGSRSA